MTREDEAGYWEQRKKELLEQMARDEEDLFEKLKGIYASEAAKLEREIAAYYQRFGEGNVIEYRMLLASLSEEDRLLLIERMDEFARKYPQYAHLMPVRESIYMLNELEGIQTAIRLQQLEIGAIDQELMRAHFEEQAQRAANLAAEQMGFGSNFYTVNASVIQETVGAAWASGGSFSQRVWDNREKLAAYLNDDFAKLIARGVSYDQCVKEMSERFANVSSRDMMRLVYTEGTFLFNEAQAQVHESDFECYALSCVNDKRTCKVCRELQRTQKDSPVRLIDRKPGVNFPPLHPWCRCSYTVEVDDWDAWIDAYVAKRGGDSLTHANRLIGDASEREPSVSSLLRSMESKDVSLAGFDYRIKGESSLARKIRTDAMQIGGTEEAASNLIHDVLRYTYVLPTKTFVGEFSRIRSTMESMGYTMVKVKNTLQFKKQGYRGVNTQVATPDGYVFELQFHTKQSLDVKERLNHPIYEKVRLPDTSEDEKKRLSAEMVKNSASIPTPPNIGEVSL